MITVISKLTQEMFQSLMEMLKSSHGRWKTNFYSYIMGLDEELWDILKDGVGDLDLDEEGAAFGRKKHTLAQKKIYKKHHKIKGQV